MRNKQGITIAALIIAIIGLSIGFAAFSNTLTIRSTATVTPSASNLRVVFSNANNSESTSLGVAPNNPTYGDAGTINNSTQGQSLISGLHAKFTEPGQTVKYNTNLYVYNAGSLQAQLTGITYNNVAQHSSYRKCTAVDYLSDNDDTNDHLQATQSLVNDACNGISISVRVGNATTNPSNTSLKYQILNTESSLPVEITITYAQGSAYADGPFDVTFGDIVINATSAVDTSLVPTNLWVTTHHLTSDNVVYGETYYPNGNSDWVDYFSLDDTTGAFNGYANGGTINYSSSQLQSQGIDIGSNYMLMDVELLGYPFQFCQMIVFDGPGTASYYNAAKTGASCTYEETYGTNGSNFVTTYSVSS